MDIKKKEKDRQITNILFVEDCEANRIEFTQNENKKKTMKMLAVYPTAYSQGDTSMVWFPLLQSLGSPYSIILRRRLKPFTGLLSIRSFLLRYPGSPGHFDKEHFDQSDQGLTLQVGLHGISHDCQL